MTLRLNFKVLPPKNAMSKTRKNGTYLAKKLLYRNLSVLAIIYEFISNFYILITLKF